MLPTVAADQAAVRAGRDGRQASAATESGHRTGRIFISARSRILGWSIALLALALIATTVVTHALLLQNMNSRINSELAHEITEFRLLATRQHAISGNTDRPDDNKPATPGTTVLGLFQARTSAAGLEQDIVLLGVMHGAIVTTSGNFSPQRGPGKTVLSQWSALRTPQSGTVQMAAGPARYSAIPVQVSSGGTKSRGVFVAAALTASQQASVNEVTTLQIEVGTIALLLGSILAWLVAGRVLRPVRDTTEIARRITETDLHERIPIRGRNEVSDLAVTFNRMLDRLESAMSAQRSFLADAGHELRTPITIIQGNLDTLSTQAPEDTETLAIVADEISRMSRIVDELLLLASSERPDFLHPEPTDLAQLTSSVVAKARALDDRPWTLTGTARGVAMLDPQRITQALIQLAANAVAHTPPGSAVEIGSQVRGQMIEFTVSDHGPGIPPEARDRVFARFARLDPRRTDGSGLGLSIVAAIAAAHHGTVSLDGAESAGATFRIAVPFEPVPPPRTDPPGRPGQPEPDQPDPDQPEPPATWMPR